MDLFEKINADIKSAMLAKDKVRLETLRGIKKEFIEAKTAKGGDGTLSDDVATKILVKMVKQRKESASIYASQNRADLSENELAEAAVIEEYLPKQLSEEELTAELQKIIAEVGATSAKEMGVQVKHFQSNHEGAIVDEIQAAYGKFDGIVINPAAYTHTSVAILDALKAVGIPAVEVHISDVDNREEFRKISYAGLACVKTIKGHGLQGYREAMEYLVAQYG